MFNDVDITQLPLVKESEQDICLEQNDTVYEDLVVGTDSDVEDQFSKIWMDLEMETRNVVKFQTLDNYH